MFIVSVYRLRSKLENQTLLCTHEDPSMNYSGSSIVKCSTDKESNVSASWAESAPLTGTIHSPGWVNSAFHVHAGGGTLGLGWKSWGQSDKLATSPSARGGMSLAALLQNTRSGSKGVGVESIWCICCTERNYQSQQEKQPVHISTVLEAFQVWGCVLAHLDPACCEFPHFCHERWSWDLKW